MRRGDLYGAATASLLLAHATLARQARNAANDESVPTAFVTLDVPNKSKTTEALTFRLDVEQSNHACDQGNLRINGHRLNQTVNGGGQGIISRSGDTAVRANWLFSCLQSEKAPYDQAVSVTVYEVDGRPIEPAGFETFFRQRHPVSIVDVDGAAVVNRLHTLSIPQAGTQERPLTNGVYGQDKNEAEPRPTLATAVQDDIHSKVQELDLLRIQARRLGDLIFEKEQAIAQLLGKKPPVPSVKVDNCESIRCVLSYLSRKFKDATGTLGKDLAELKGFVADADDVRLPTPDDLNADFWREAQTDDDVEDENEPDVYEITNKDGSWEWEEEVVLTAEEVTALQEADRHAYRFHRRQPRLLTAIALAILAICSLSLWAIHHLHRRTRQASRNETQALGSTECQWSLRESCAERRARRQARKESVRAVVQGLLSRWKGARHDDLEKTVEEKAQDVEEGDTTMEEEIAQFREAAAMVGDIVAAEEGRARRSHQGQNAVDVGGDEADSPPSYESVSNESSVVANGFRYTPGSSPDNSDHRKSGGGSGW
ncbi:hypothetical protein JDV02_007932 [Purpureocillium takamizusanense]|uniref:Uncharacterized protein n=1 Tax=Purpureocillium takamizusanense TaxID=2060973 RepID=A0A9Q8QMM1_9HYPO|nr:uncharacterized protein JDV02_007932 [Purpureocillium takamizusanense]UNI22002.1 hypothetical protein JDV02_007932 [Purpureocillium takamizusanense]